MDAEADALSCVTYGARSPDRTHSRNGYRPHGWDTRAGTIDLPIPKLRSGVVKGLVATGTFTAALRIPGTVGPMQIAANLRTSQVEVHVDVIAPDRGPTPHPGQLAPAAARRRARHLAHRRSDEPQR